MVLQTRMRSFTTVLQRMWPANAVDRVLIVGMTLGFIAYVRIALLAEYAFNDWMWVNITRSSDRWLEALSHHETVRITSQVLLGTSFSLFGYQTFVPAFVLVAANLLGVFPAARIFEKFGLSSRAAWLAAACGILCSANGDVALFLAQSETAVGRTLVLMTLHRGLDEAPGALWRAIPWLVLAFTTHEFSLYILPMLVFAILLLHRSTYLRVWIKRPDTIGFALVWTILAASRFALLALVYDPHGTHALSLAGIPQNVAFFATQLLALIVADRALPLVVVIAILAGIRARDIDWQTWTRRIVPISLVWTILAYTLYFTASRYRSSYFFVLSAVAASAPFGWLADRALTVVERMRGRAIVLAVTVAASVVAPIPLMDTHAAQRDALRAIREATHAAISRDPDAPIRCAWIVSSNEYTNLMHDTPIAAIIDIERPHHSTMLAMLYPKTEFMVVELRPDQLGHLRPAPEDAIVRLDHDEQFITPPVVSRPVDRPKIATDCIVNEPRTP